MNYVIILGHEMHADGQLSGCSIARVDKAVQVFGSGGDVVYVTSGGLLRPHWPISLAEAITSRLAEFWGVNRSQIIQLFAPRDTVGEAVFSRLALDCQRSGRIHVVTQKYHGPRAQIIFDYVYGDGGITSMTLAPDGNTFLEKAGAEIRSIDAFHKTFRGVLPGDIRAIELCLYQRHALYKKKLS